jgi:hypothetical protein
MKHKYWLFDLLSEPDKIKGDDAMHFTEISQAYPWFAQARLLMAKAKKVEDETAFNAYLPIASVYAHDRSLLFDLIHQPWKKTEDEVPVNTKQEIHQEELTNDVSIENPIETLLDAVSTNPAITLESNEIPSDLIKLESENDSEAQLIEARPIINQESFDNIELTPVLVQEIIEVESPEESSTKTEINEAILNSEDTVIEITTFDESAAETENTYNTSETFVSTPDSESAAIEFDGLSDQGSSEELQPKKVLAFGGFTVNLNAIETREGISENDPLEVLERYNPMENAESTVNLTTEEPEDPIGIKSIENDIQTVEESSPKVTSSFFDWLGALKDTKIAVHQGDKITPTIKAEPVEEEKIIETFISNNPVTVRPNVKIAFYDPVDKAKKSEIEPEDLVTETLAKIYLKQQLYHKAIKIYEKLKLTMPEKKDYFAALIQKIKEDHHLN